MITMDDSESVSLKAVILGCDGTGKTSLIRTYLNGEFPGDEEYVPLVTDVVTVDHCEHKGKHITLSIWDTSSGIDYEEHRNQSYKDADVFVVFFNLVCESDIRFELIVSRWIEELSPYSQNKIPIILVGAQTDLRESKRFRMLTSEQGEAMALKSGCAKYVEISSLRNEGVIELFSEVVKIGYKYKFRTNRTHGTKCLIF